MEYAHAADAEFDSISIARCRELLGDEAEGLSDRDVDRIRQHADTMAREVYQLALTTPGDRACDCIGRERRLSDVLFNLKELQVAFLWHSPAARFVLSDGQAARF